jgi:uncharacterized protein YbbC (DUF1343 family)
MRLVRQRRPGAVLCLCLAAWLSCAGAAAGEFKLGVEVLLAGYVDLLEGKRVGLFTNQSGIDTRGRATIDLFHNHPDIRLVKLFSPEHGIRGKIKAGAKVNDSRDRRTGLPIISLYGGDTGFRPTAEHLRGVDILVYDVQDVGSRAYTYIWSMAEAMTACGKHNVQMMVLDRPCVFGADTVDGPICDTRYNSLLTRVALPRVYGMTAGELARYFNARHGLGCHLTVIPMAGYERGMTFRQTGARWVPPSPNIPDVNAACLFPATGTLGMCGQVHMGIHTEHPFQLVGAPWLDARHAAETLSNCGLQGVAFKPSSFVSKGFFKGKRVHCVLMEVTDVTAIRPATIELVWLVYLSRTYPEHFVWERKRQRGFDRAMGTASVRLAVQRGDSLQTILRSWRRQQQRFRRQRKAFLIYPRRQAVVRTPRPRR